MDRGKKGSNLGVVKEVDDKKNKLLEAIKKGKEDVAIQLIESGADVNDADDDNEDTALILAGRRGMLKVVKKLVTAGALIDATTKEGSPALLEALRFSNEDVADYLIECGADVNIADVRGRHCIDSCWR